MAAAAVSRGNAWEIDRRKPCGRVLEGASLTPFPVTIDSFSAGFAGLKAYDRCH